MTTSLYDIYFINNQTGWCCGANGIILKTTNSGLNWITQNSGINRELQSIYFINENTGWAVSRVVGYILKTIDGGNLWEIKYSTSLRSFNRIFALDQNNIWITGVGGFGYMYKSSNGGMSWDSSIVYSGNGYDVLFQNASSGVSSFGNNIYFTSNGGNNWLLTFSGTGEIVSLSNNGNIIHAISNVNYYYRTSNFGLNWVFISNVPAPSNTQSIFFSSINTGWVCGDNDYLNKTTNSGLNWIRQNTQSNVFLSAVYFATDSIGWTCGALGKIFFTSTSGAYVGFGNQNEITLPGFELKQNFPNPFNPVTEIKFNLPQNTFLSLIIYNVLGEEVLSLVKNEYKEAGSYSVKFDGSDLASGLYYYSITAGLYKDIKKMVLIK